MAYSGKNVKICASHAGLTLGEDGATHQILEDIGMMKMLPGMTVIVPCDYASNKSGDTGHCWIPWTGLFALWPARMAHIYQRSRFWNWWKRKSFLRDLTSASLPAAIWSGMPSRPEHILQEKGISVEVINIHTVKPLDEKAVLNSISKTKCAVTAEEHNIIGGLGDAIAQCAA